MKSRSEIWLCALSELGAQCSVNTHRDANNAASRVAREGDTFFKVTLPQFGKDLETALSMSRIPRSLFKGYRRSKLEVVVLDGNYEFPMYSRKFSGGNPQFLGGFLDLVFRNKLEMTADALSFAEGRPDVLLVPQIRREMTGEEVARMADAITAIRQLCLMFSKERELCTPARTSAAYDQFISTDKELDRPLWTSGSTPSSEEIDSLLFGGRSE